MHSKATSSKRICTNQNDVARRQASLRKAVLGREAVRDRPPDARIVKGIADGSLAEGRGGLQLTGSTASGTISGSDSDTSDVTPWPEFDDLNEGSNENEFALASLAPIAPQPERPPPTVLTSPPVSYKSTTTTDEDEALHMSQPKTSGFRPNLSIPSGLDSFFAKRKPPSRRRPSQIARPPLSYTAVGLSTTSVSSDADDYGETEIWGWIILAVTWFVFVTGVGSCFGVWGWAWDVGTTPYAPPEFEDDPTLPIVGYYPALMVLTCVMAWIWVMVAWVGMKYFRHAKITGD